MSMIPRWEVCVFFFCHQVERCWYSIGSRLIFFFVEIIATIWWRFGTKDEKNINKLAFAQKFSKKNCSSGRKIIHKHVWRVVIFLINYFLAAIFFLLYCDLADVTQFSLIYFYCTNPDFVVNQMIFLYFLLHCLDHSRFFFSICRFIRFFSFLICCDFFRFFVFGHLCHFNTFSFFPISINSIFVVSLIEIFPQVTSCFSRYVNFFCQRWFSRKSSRFTFNFVRSFFPPSEGRFFTSREKCVITPKKRT